MSPACNRLISSKGQIRAGRIIGIGEEDDARPLAHASEDGIDIRLVIAFGCDDRRCAIGLDGDRIDKKAMLRVDGLIAWPQICMCEKLQQLVRSRAAHDALRIEPVARRDRLAQVARRPIGIKRQ